MFKLMGCLLILLQGKTECNVATLTVSSNKLTVGTSFTFSCHFENYNSIEIFTNKGSVCTITGKNDDGSCKFFKYIEDFIYTCSPPTSTVTLTIPETFRNDSYHRTNWQCQDPLQGTSSQPFLLYINVPISSIDIISGTTGIAVGHTHTLSCKTNFGRPNARIEWYLSDGTNLTTSATQQPDCGQCINQVESTSNVTYIGNRSDHGKSIYCVGSNLEGRTKTSQNVTIIILYGPSSVVLSPSNTSYTVTEGSGSVGPIICTADCRPNCSMTWSGPNLPDGTTSELKLQNINRNQTGSYQCTANNSVDSLASSIVTVIVNYGPNYVVLTPFTPPYTVTESKGSVGPITCTADCRPNCTMTWSGPNLPGGITYVLMLKTINRNQAGDFQCRANNSVGSLTSEKVTVTVNYKPGTVTLQPTTLSYDVNETSGIGNITCTADCKPHCTMTWSGPNLPGSTTSVLILKDINRNQAGGYTCTANNSVGSNTSAVITVDVNYGPYSVLLNTSATSITVVETTGSIGPITCTAGCRPYCTMTWNGPNLPGQTTPVLSLQNINRNQAGSYMCTANNFLGSNNSRILEVIVNYGPNDVILNPVDKLYTVLENEDNLGPITCTTDCRPNCTMTWSGPNLPGGTTSPLNITNINRIMAGDYWCTANNSFGNYTSAVVTVIVHYGPTIQLIEGNTTHYENDTAEFRCHVDSIPKSLIKWTFMDIHSVRTLPDANESIFKVNGSLLIVSPINCLSMGLYSCHANNSISSTQMDSKVTVLCTPRLNTIEYDVTDIIAVRDKQPLNITAPVIAYPKPWIYWQFFQNGSSINITKDVKNSYNQNRHFSYLYIQNMTQNDFGVYAIYAGNGIGDNANYIGIYDVQAARRPNKPSNVSCSAGHNYIIVNWKPGFHGGSPQSFRVFYKTIQSNSFTGHSGNISEAGYHPVKILNLHSSSVYLLKVHAENIYNTTMSDEVQCNTTSQGNPKTESLIAVGVGAGVGSAVVVICIVIALLFLFRRLRMKNPKNDTEPIKRSNEEEENDELKDNPMYVSSADDVLYQSDIDIQVSKEKKQVISSTNPKKRKKKDKSNKPIELGCVYENADDIMKRTEQIYANQQDVKQDITIEYNPQKNKDGLIYADLDLSPTSKGQRFVIHGMDNRNNYAIIDLSKTADPLPSDDEEETVKSEENKN